MWMRVQNFRAKVLISEDSAMHHLCQSFSSHMSDRIKILLELRSALASFLAQMLFNKANLAIEGREKIASIGPNGCGNSTLLKLIMGFVKTLIGEVIIGEHNVLPNYFEQNQAEKTVLETAVEAAVDWRIDDIKGLLGRCNFKADMLERKVSLLSGGEKAHLAFCKFMVKPSTLCVLDEPTNHLDITSKEMFEVSLPDPSLFAG